MLLGNRLCRLADGFKGLWKQILLSKYGIVRNGWVIRESPSHHSRLCEAFQFRSRLWEISDVGLEVGTEFSSS